MIIPPEKLTVEALRSIVESVIIREGTDYGVREFTLDEKVGELLPKIHAGDVLISYDEESETVTLLPKETATQSA
ncbi:MAG: YheU family protein [Agarilytica sp.]